MRALLSHEPGGPETLRLDELPDPVAGPGELLVRVRACSINYPDVLIIEDKYQLKPPRPFAPGSEIAGEVEAVGEDVTGWNSGDRLIAAPGYGGLAEKIAIPAARGIRLPADRSFEEGSALQSARRERTPEDSAHVAALEQGQVKRELRYAGREADNEEPAFPGDTAQRRLAVDTSDRVEDYVRA